MCRYNWDLRSNQFAIEVGRKLLTKVAPRHQLKRHVEDRQQPNIPARSLESAELSDRIQVRFQRVNDLGQFTSG